LFKAFTKETLFENAFPSIENRLKLTQHCLRVAAKSKGDGANVIKERVKKDEDFVRSLQDLVLSSSLLLFDF
jgi:hypothetical protein